MRRRGRRGREVAQSTPEEFAPPAPAPPLWWIGAVLAAAGLAVYSAAEADFWFHLAAGRSILAHGLPSSEPWCLAAKGHWPWLAEWLFHCALFLVRAVGGDVGVALWRAAWAGLAVFLLLRLARLAGASWWMTLLLLPLLFDVTRPRQTARPEQISLAMVLLFSLVFEQARRAGRDRTVWLLPAQVLWANLHVLWFAGPLIAWLYGALELLRGGAGTRRALRWSLIGLLLFAAGAITPRPLDTLTLRALHETRTDPGLSTVWEMRRWSPADWRTSFSAFLGLGLLGALMGAGHAWRASPPLTLAALAGLAGGLSVNRLQGLGATLALPALAVALGGGRVGLALACAAAVTGSIALGAHARFFPPGLGPVWTAVPVRATAVADTLGIDGPVFNTSWFGGYILWRRGEAHLPLIDTRLRGDNVFRSRYTRAHEDVAALDTLVREWGFTHAILQPPLGPEEQTPAAFATSPEWALVFADDAGLLFVRRRSYPAIAESLGYWLWTPDYAAMARIARRAMEDPALSRALEGELVRARASSPWHSRASLWLGLMELARGRSKEALRLFDEVERLAPLTPGLALRQGMARELSGDLEDARASYRRALRDTSDAAAAREALERLDGHRAPASGRRQ